MKNKFSIIVPVYNGEKVVERCVQSVISLNYQEWELIIVDDGSTDNTKSVLSKYLDDQRIKYIPKINGGVSSARNIGINIATGDYILFLDVDDLLTPNICNYFLEKIKHTDFIISGYKKQYADGRCEDAYNSNDTMVSFGLKSIPEFANIFDYLYSEGFLNSPWAKCYKKELITKDFDESCSIGEDLMFNLSYLRNCQSIEISLESVYVYTIQVSGSLSTSLIKNGFENLTSVYDETIKFSSEVLKDVYQSRKSILEKYLLDMLVMIERNIRINSKNFSFGEMDATIEKYKLHELSQNTLLTRYGIKWKIVNVLLKHDKDRMVYLILKIISILKK